MKESIRYLFYLCVLFLLCSVVLTLESIANNIATQTKIMLVGFTGEAPEKKETNEERSGQRTVDKRKNPPNQEGS